MTALVQDSRPGSADDSVLFTIHISINTLAHFHISVSTKLWDHEWEELHPSVILKHSVRRQSCRCHNRQLNERLSSQRHSRDHWEPLTIFQK